MPGLILDFETASACNLKVCGAWRYSEDPTTEILSLSWGYEHTDRIGHWTPADGIAFPKPLAEAMARDNVLFVSHGEFERAIWLNQCVALLGWPPMPSNKWHDTMAVCAMRCIPLSLDDACRVMRIPFQKDKEGSKLTISLSKTNKAGYYERDPEKLSRSLLYNDNDIRSQRGLHERIGWLPPGERRIWLMNQRINARGFMLDMPLVHQMQRVVDLATVPLAEEFRGLTGGLNFTQRDKVMAWVQGEGVNLPNLKKETLDKLLGTDEDEDDISTDPIGIEEIELPANVERALRIRQLVGSASVKKLARMRACVCADGRVRGTTQYHGAGTGREAGRLLQPTNFPRGSNDVIQIDPADKVTAIMTGDPDMVEMLTGIKPVELVVGSLRHTLIASAGREYVAGDFAGIEARVDLALAGQHDKCDLLASGYDAYIDMATDIYGMPKFDFSDKKLVKAFKEAHTAERTIGKNSVLGCGFQMGWQTFKRRYCPEQPDDFAERVVKAYREKWAPKVPLLWRGLEDAALETALTGLPHEAYGVEYAREDWWLTARLPSGRKLWYFDPKVIEKEMPWSTPDNRDIRTAWACKMRKGAKWVTADMYGGLLTENVVQALARDLLWEAVFKCEANGLPVVLTVYDEIVCEPERRPDNQTALEQIMRDTPKWGLDMRIPVEVEAWTGDRYRK